MTDPTPISITYFADVLCVWAYVAQQRLDEAKREFGDQVEIDFKCCSVFGDTAQKIGQGWRDRGGYEAFGAHVREVAERFPHIEVHPDLWGTVRPATSETAHLFIKAVSLLDARGVVEQCERPPERTPSEEFAWRLRLAFFRDSRDIAIWEVQCEVAEAMGIDVAALEQTIRDGTALAALAADHQDRDRFGIEGSPTFLMNEGRQKLFGNVGYRVIEANIRELLRTPHAREVSWC